MANQAVDTVGSRVCDIDIDVNLNKYITESQISSSKNKRKP
jgi:hypothetical protein